MSFSLLGSFISQARASSYIDLKPAWRAQSLWSQFDSMYFFSNANYSAEGGEFKDLTDSNDFTNLKFQPSLFYGVSPSFNIYLGFEGTHSETGTVLGVEQATLFTGVSSGLNYIVSRSFFRWLFNLDLFYSTDKIQDTRKDILTSDGVSIVTPKLIIYKRIKNFTFQSHLGLEVPFEELSKKLLWGAGVNFRLPNTRLFIGTEVEGINSIIDDKETENPSTRTTVTDTLAAESLYYYSVNPDLLSAKAFIDFKVTKQFSVKLSYLHTLNGKSKAAGYGGIMNLKWAIKRGKSFKKYHFSRKGRRKFQMKNNSNSPRDIEDQLEMEIKQNKQ